MAEYSALPPELSQAEEFLPPAPGVFPPPAEGAVGASADGGAERGRRHAQKRKKALLLALAGAALCGVITLTPPKPGAAAEPPAETAAPVTEPAQTSPPETAPAAPTDAERLVAVGTWKNEAESEWVHFSVDGAGWWYDGTYFGLMVWEEDAAGSVSYEAGMTYLGPGLRFQDEHTPEKEGDCLHSVKSGGGIALLPDEDRFTCPGLRFGEGVYLPDDTPIDASVTDGVCGKTAAELLSGTVWRMVKLSDLGIPVAPSLEGGTPGVYTDLVYVQTVDFSAGTFTLATRDDGLLWREDWTVTGELIYSDAADTLDVPFALTDGEECAGAAVDIRAELTTFGYFSDLHPGDVEYNNMHFLWGRQIGHQSMEVYLLITSAGIRLGIDCIDLFADNYALLAADPLR